MATVTFDTHKFVKTLKEAGVPEPQAEAFSTAVQESHEAAELATKADLRGLATKTDLAEMKFELLKWLIGLGIAQAGLLVGLLRFLP